jgi:hypothetical protein
VSDHEHRTPVEIGTVSADDPHLQPAAKNPDTVEHVTAFTFVLGLLGVAGFGAA